MSSSIRPDGGILNPWLAQLGVALLYLVLGLATQGLIRPPGELGVFWPGAGLALAALLLGGRRLIGGVLLGSLVLNALSHASLWAVLGLTLADVLPALSGNWLLSRRGPAPVLLRTLSDYLRLVVMGGGVAGLLGALLGPGFLLLAGELGAADYARRASYWWMGGVLGVVLITPLLLAWWRPPRWPSLSPAQWFEGLLLVGLIFVAGQIMFLDWGHAYLTQTRAEYVMFALVAWLAIRMGQRGLTGVLLLMALQALAGPNLVNYWAYMLTLAVVGMALATYVSELKQLLNQLKLKDEALNATGNSIVITDQDGRIEWANPAFSQVTGYSLAELLGRNPCELVKSGQHDAAYYRAMWDTLLAKKKWRGELTNRRKDGSLYQEDTLITPMLNERGAITHYVAVKLDVSEHKRLEQQRLALHERNQELSRLLVRAQERARQRFARELHERTSPNLAALRLNLDLITQSAGRGPADAEFAARVQDTQALLEDTDQSVREICAELSPTALEHGSLAEALASYVPHFVLRTGLPVRLHGTQGTQRLSPERELALFRIVQEALTNCAKHAQASAVELGLHLDGSGLRLSVVDDGIGFDPAQVAAAGFGAGQGLRHMRETAEFIGARLHLVSAPGRGTRIEVETGLNPEPALKFQI